MRTAAPRSVLARRRRRWQDPAMQARRARRASTLAAAALALAMAVTTTACGARASDAGGTDSSIGPADDAATDAGAPAMVSGVVYEYGTVPFAPLGGATVTVLDAVPAVTTVTAPDGTYALALPGGALAWLRVALAGEVDQQKAVVPPAGGATVDFALVPDSGVAMVQAVLGVTLDAADGSLIACFATTDTGGGLAVALSAAHDPSFTFGPGGAPAFADQTVAGGEPILLYPNVVAGTTTVAVTAPPAIACTPRYAVADWRVDPTVFTWIDLDCVP
jgi:hypothetical protein